MCADVCSDHSGTASLREKSIICLSHRMFFSVKSEKLPVFFMNMILKKTGNNSVGGHVFCQNAITEGGFEGTLVHNCEGTEQLLINLR